MIQKCRIVFHNSKIEAFSRSHSIQIHNPLTNTTQIFDSKTELIKIGRGDDCEVVLKGKGISKYQCTILKENNLWFIKDGYGNHLSKNGTWLLLKSNESISLKPGYVIMIDNTKFKIC